MVKKIFRYFTLSVFGALAAVAGAMAKPAGMTLKKDNFRIVVAEDEVEPVKLAVETLRRDFHRVMHFIPEVADKTGTQAGIEIVVVNESLEHPVVDVAGLRPLDGFESHRVYADAANGRIYLAGKDMRGTIYAIYSFSEEILGVPPLWFYCSWDPAYKSAVKIPAGYDYYMKSPQVRYRAWFPNDTDLFTPWRKLSWENNELWLETMLRLKLNTVELERTVLYPDCRLNDNAMLLHKYGLVLTSHHHIAVNSDFRQWGDYWRKVRKMDPPKFSLDRMQDLIDFWSYSIEAVKRSGVENLWQISFRGAGDQPYWIIFPDAPETDKERAEVINDMIRVQLDLIKKSTDDPDPYVRMTFYDELSDLLAAGYLDPPAGENMLWTYVAARRDHYPNDDIVNFDTNRKVKLGYYMNLQFTSTGAHLAPAESPWKMEANYRYVNSKAPLQFSVVNAGNVREFIMEMSANAKMMWDYAAYDSDDFFLDYCAQYFGQRYAKQIAGLFRDYYYSYWTQKPSDFPGFDRQYLFHDLRYGRALDMIAGRFWKFTPSPLGDIGYERVKGRSFRLGFDNQVDSLLKGTEMTAPKFKKVADDCEKMMARLPQDRVKFFRDNLYVYARYMEHLNNSLYHFVMAYKGQADKALCGENLALAKDYMEKARQVLYTTQEGVFEKWYAGDWIFGFDKKLKNIERLQKENDKR